MWLVGGRRKVGVRGEKEKEQRLEGRRRGEWF